jgi:hypothetical protein
MVRKEGVYDIDSRRHRCSNRESAVVDKPFQIIIRAIGLAHHVGEA